MAVLDRVATIRPATGHNQQGHTTFGTVYRAWFRVASVDLGDLSVAAGQIQAGDSLTIRLRSRPVVPTESRVNIDGVEHEVTGRFEAVRGRFQDLRLEV